MLSESLLFLLLLLVIGLIAKNSSLMIAIAVLLLLKIGGLETKSFSFLQSKGINWGVTLITIAVLAPIASGDIGFKDLTSSFKSPYAWIALISGMHFFWIDSEQSLSQIERKKSRRHLTKSNTIYPAFNSTETDNGFQLL